MTLRKRARDMTRSQKMKRVLSRLMISGILVMGLGVSLSACGKRGEPLRPSEVTAEQASG
jgi:predicted small lipoprotein YifL